MRQKIYQIDAFSDKKFSGNPAAICVLENWIDDGLMQQIAGENNLAETAFIVKNGAQYTIRWFTPSIEVDLCGHATLAAAYVLFNYYGYSQKTIDFYSHRSGLLPVEKGAEDLLTLNFPADELTIIEPYPELNTALGKIPLKTLKGKTDYLLIYASEKEIEEIRPDFALLAKTKGRGVIVSSQGNEVDFVSRFFGPQSGIDEDPVTGSAHTTLTPYWAKELGKNQLTAKQLSKRQGDLFCENLGERIKISGKAVCYLIGEIEI